MLINMRNFALFPGSHEAVENFYAIIFSLSHLDNRTQAYLNRLQQ